MDKTKDKRFDWFTKMLALSTEATFSYTPAIEEIKAYFAKKRNISLSKIEDIEISEKDIEECTSALIQH